MSPTKPLLPDVNRRQFLTAGALSAAALTSLSSRLYAAETYPIASLRSGKVRGVTQQGIHVFRGIPYGADTAPVRFLPALKEASWKHTRDALEFGASAPQLGREQVVSEDCLFLNVTTPALRDGVKRPILFYIHGGGYNNMSGSSPLYDGINLCLRDNVVVITVNHRLNAFGYLYLGHSANRDYRYSGNLGQLDLVQALQWVQQHAAEFGGDKDNVTVFGQSGGGAKINTLMAMPAAKGLFHKAFTMSGQQITAAGPRAAAQRSDLLLNELKFTIADIEKLRALPFEKILEAARVRDPSRIERSGLYFGPVLDQAVLFTHPFYPEAPAQSANIPLVIGNTKDETRAFLGNDAANFVLTWEQLAQKIEEQQYSDLNPERVIKVYRELYPDYSPSDIFFAATTAGRSWRGAVLEAEARARQGKPAFVYQLDFASPDQGGKFGAFHSLDIPLVFDTLLQPNSRTGHDERAQKVADQMSRALLAFARTGNPTHSGIPDWKPYTLEKRETLVVNTQSTLVNDPRGKERELYAEVPFIQRGTF